MSHQKIKNDHNAQAADKGTQTSVNLMYQDRDLLEAFVVNNQDLEQLEAMLAEFNIFEAIGVIRQEIRHSHFLAFLLNPVQNHGLGDVFLKRWLKNVLIEAERPPVSPVDIDIAEMRHVEVRREWRHIDILVHDPENALVCFIENKIYSGEHSNQLERYHTIVKNEFPGYRLIPIFLSPEGEQPSYEAFIPTSYGTIVRVLEDVCTTYRSVVGSEVTTLIAHYMTMLRRHIVSDSEIAKLCQKIYRQHKEALDLIFEHRPDLQSDIAELLAKFVTRDFSHHQLRLFGNDNKRYFHFHAQEWEQLPESLQDAPIEYGDLPLLFEIQNEPSRLVLRLCIARDRYDAPYPEPVCQLLLKTAQTHPNIFRQPDRKIMRRWTWMHQDEFLSTKDYDGADVESLKEKIEAKWKQFLTKDLPKVRTQMSQIDWLELKLGSVNT